MKKKILFTGGSGLLAINWALAIRDKYETVNGLHHRSIRLPGAETAMIDMESIDTFADQLSDINPQVVVHCASMTGVEDCENNPALAEHVNVTIANNVAVACRKLGIQMVYISTDHLYGGDQIMTTEEMPTTPVNVYGKTKAKAEECVLSVSSDFLAIRTNFYGWGSSYRQSFSDYILSALRRKERISLFKDVFYTPILIDTLAKASMELIGKGAKGIFNVVGGDRISKYEFGMRLANQFGLDESLINPICFAERKDLVKRPLELSLSNKKAVAFVGHHFGNIDNDIKELYRQEQSGFALQIQHI